MLRAEEVVCLKIKDHVADQLHIAMAQNGITTEEVAAEIGVAKSSVQEYLGAKRNLRTDTLELISQKLDIPIEVLVSGNQYLDLGSSAGLYAVSDALSSLHPLLWPLAQEHFGVLEKIFRLSDSVYALEEQAAEWEHENPCYLYTPLRVRGLSGFHSLYGLCAKQRNGDSWDTVTVAAPFSNDWATVFDLTQHCSKLQISPSQLPEVIYDFFASRQSD